MKKISFVIILLLTFYVNSFTQDNNLNLITNVLNRNKISLNGRWNYIVDPYENGYYNYRREPYDESEFPSGGFFLNQKQKDKSERIEYDFDLSPAMTIPGDWNSQANELKFYEGTIWFKRTFEVNKKENKRYFLYFGAVNYEAHVYLNGKKLGMHIGGFTPFNFEVTNLLKNGENFVIVKVNNVRRIDGVPTINTDWWNYGGITRDVFLIETNYTFIQDYKIQLSKDNNQLIEGFVKLNGEEKKQSGFVIISKTNIKHKISTDENGYAEFKIPVKDLSLWSPENPFLYDIKIVMKTDSVDDQIGFRTIAVKGNDILLNGKPIFLRGICIHEENPLKQGRAYSEGEAFMLLNWAKELNCNYVRLAHYPHNEYMIRTAEKLGLLVWEEIPVYWTIQWNNEGTLNNALNQLTEMIMRDKNRANVIIWSIGNETPVTQERLKFMKALADKARQLDNTRLISAALQVYNLKDNPDVYIMDDPLGEFLDVVSFNEYIGWYEGKPEKLTNIKWQFKYDKPILISETGAGALQGFYADSLTVWSEEYQEYFFKMQINMIKKLNQVKGFTPWILVDFRSPRRQHPVYQNFWNRKGLISSSGIKKKAFYILKNFYQEILSKNIHK